MEKLKKQVSFLETENQKLKRKLKDAQSSIESMKKIHNIETTNFKKLTEFLNEKHKSCKGTEYDQLLKEFENKKTELKF